MTAPVPQAVKHGPPVIWPLQTYGMVQRQRFARSVRPEHHNQFALPHRE